MVNGVVPVLQPIAVRAVRPSEAAQGIVGIGIVPIAYKVPVAAQLPGGVVGPLGLFLPVIGLARQPVQVVVLVSDLQPVAVLRPGKVPVVLLVGVLHQGLAPGSGLQWIAEGIVGEGVFGGGGGDAGQILLAVGIAHGGRGAAVGGAVVGRHLLQPVAVCVIGVLRHASGGALHQAEGPLGGIVRVLGVVAPVVHALGDEAAGT